MSLQQPLRVLLIEDAEADAELVLHLLKRFGMNVIPCRVETEAQLRSTLPEFHPSVILSDYELPGFNGQAALKIARELDPSVPFLFVSGKMNEQVAIGALQRGATDYIFKNNLARLGPAVARAVKEAARQRTQEAQITRLDRVLRMASGIHAAVVRIRDRGELLREVCRLAISIGGYAAVVASMRMGGQPALQPVAWQGADERLAEQLRILCIDSIERHEGIADQAIRSGDAVVQEETASLAALIALPILSDGTAVGVVLLALNPGELVAEQELRMLREVGGNLSFAWQFPHKDCAHPESIGDNHFWQRRADEARAIAEQFDNADARRIMLGIADGYEQIGRTADRLVLTKEPLSPPASPRSGLP